VPNIVKEERRELKRLVQEFADVVVELPDGLAELECACELFRVQRHVPQDLVLKIQQNLVNLGVLYLILAFVPEHKCVHFLKTAEDLVHVPFLLYLAPKVFEDQKIADVDKLVHLVL